MKDFRKEGHAPNLIFATGDIAHSGKAAEYKLATQFFDDLLKAAGLRRRHLVIVPGNHNVDRSLGVGLPRTLRTEKTADAYFSPDAKFRHLRLKLKAFASWYNRYFDGIRSLPKNSTCGPVEAINIRGVKIGILPINTVLFSQNDGDHTRLWVGRRCMDVAIQILQKLKAQYTVAIHHHPLDWLCEKERSNIRIAVTENVLFDLCGHLHDPEVEVVDRGRGQAVRMVTGAAYNTRKYPNKAIYCTVDGEDVRVFPICYNDKPGEVWTVDTSLFPKEDGYEKQFTIQRLAPTRTVISNEGVIVDEGVVIDGEAIVDELNRISPFSLSEDESRQLVGQLYRVLQEAELKARQAFTAYRAPQWRPP